MGDFTYGEITEKIIDAAFRVYRTLGNGGCSFGAGNKLFGGL
jgi:hypothetical protein